ncbi:MAG: hypothetical protein HQM12_00135 [SAR324 cluster bacterium]|nr:hypothetical protein [SAR324 cluster bacterium]
MTLKKQIEQKIELTYKILANSEKTKLLCLSTTANLNNPSTVFSSIRETRTTIAGSVLFRDLSFLEEIINAFDGFVDYFLVDCETKNEVSNLEEVARSLIRQSSIWIYKPNDITVDALDMWVCHLFPNMKNKKAVVVGTGNIGFKIALKLCERGMDVTLNGRDHLRLQSLSTALNLIKRGQGFIKGNIDLWESTKMADLILGCTPGIPVIDEHAVQIMSDAGIIIDVGNGTLTPGGLRSAHTRNIKIFCLFMQGGYEGMIANWEFTQQYLPKIQQKRLSSEIVIITPGTLGQYGNIIVDRMESPRRVLGVCDGTGDVLAEESAISFIQQYESLIEKGSL